MCLSPIEIQNPYFKYGSLKLPSNFRRFTPSTAKIKVPCGHCSECLLSKSDSFIQRCEVESLTSHVVSVMLSYSPHAIPTTTVFDPETNKEHLVAYPNNDHISNLIKRLRNNDSFGGRDFRYFAVSEYGSKRHRPHWHILFFVSRRNGETPQELQDLLDLLKTSIFEYWADNIGTRKHPIYRPFIKLATSTHNGKTYSNYYFKLVTPLRPDANGNLSSMPLSQEYLDAINDPSSFVSYLTKYLYKSSSFEHAFTEILDNSDFFDSEGFLVPDEHLRFLYSIFGTRRLASKGIGFGFDPDTTRKVYASPSHLNPISTDTALLRAELYNELYSQYVDLDIQPIISSLDPAHTPEFYLSKHSHFVCSQFSHSYRRRFHELFPAYPLPPRLSSQSLTLRTLDELPRTASIVAIQNIVNNCVNSNFPYFSYFSPTKGITPRPLSSFYKSFLSPDHYDRLYKSLGVNCFDDLTKLFDNSFSVRRLSRAVAYSSDCLIQAHSLNCELFANLPNYTVLETLNSEKSSLFLLSADTSRLYYTRVRRYEMSYY